MSQHRWVAHLKTKQEQESFQAKLAGSKEVLNVLRNIIEMDVKALDRAMLDKSQYSLGSWEYFQADQLGSKRALLKLMTLLQD